MNELIDSGDPRAKVVGKRRKPAEGSEALAARLDDIQRMIGKMWNGLPFPKGVHRFKTEEEFNQWKDTLMMRNSPGRRSQKTSSNSVAS